MNVPNLDAMTEVELDQFSNHARTLAQYANMRAMAITNRAAGRINEAIRIEAHLEKLYQILPTEWRW